MVEYVRNMTNKNVCNNVTEECGYEVPSLVIELKSLFELRVSNFIERGLV